MPNYAEHHRLEMSGTIAGSLETFSFGLRLKHRAGLTDDSWDDGDVQDYVTDVAVPAVGTYFGTGAVPISELCTLDTIRLYQVDRDGTRNKDHAPGVAKVSFQGGVSLSQGRNHPWQVALAVSLRASTVNTRSAKHGRFYLPVPAVAVDPATNRFPTSTRDAIVQATRTFLRSLNTGESGPTTSNVRAVLCGYGVKNNLPDIVPGPVNNIDQVLVGDVLDTIRDRRNGVAERYGSDMLADLPA